MRNEDRDRISLNNLLWDAFDRRRIDPSIMHRLRAACEAYPFDAALWKARALSALRFGLIDDAREALAHLQSIPGRVDEPLPPILEALLEGHIDAHRLLTWADQQPDAERLAAYRRCCDEFPHSPVLWFNRAVVAWKAGLLDEARASAEWTRKLSPGLAASLPDGLAPAPATPPPAGGFTRIGGYAVLKVHAESTSSLLLDAVRERDGFPVTLRLLVDVTPQVAEQTFQGHRRLEGFSDAVPRMIEIVRGDDDRVYQVLERLRGVPISVLAARGPVDLPNAVDFVAKLLAALSDLHANAVFHGALDGDCVLRDDIRLDGRVVLLGGVRGLGGGTLPISHQRIDWMAPEEGIRPADARTDNHGAGLLFYLLAAGRLPPREQRLRGEIPAIPTSGGDGSDLTGFVRRCVDPIPELRPASASQAAAQLTGLHRRTIRIAPGAVVGPWRLGRMLGETLYGGVYEAAHVEGRGAAVVKVLHPYVARRRDVRVQFVSEALAVTRVAHRHVVKVIDWSTLPDDTCYLAMEALDGRTLFDQIHGAPLGIAAAIRVCREIAEGLAAAHESGVVHRDVKPENVLLTSHGDVRVLDFGAARLLGQSMIPGQPISDTGNLIGTPAYMAPEQWEGHRDVDGRADTYALGLVLHETVAGRHPFRATTPFEWQQMHLHAQVILADEITRVPMLASLIASMLDKNRERRPSMREVVDRLRLVEHELAPTMEMKLPPQLRHARRRRLASRALVAAGAIAAASIAAVVVVHRLPERPDRQPDPRSPAPAREPDPSPAPAPPEPEPEPSDTAAELDTALAAHVSSIKSCDARGVDLFAPDATCVVLESRYVEGSIEPARRTLSPRDLFDHDAGGCGGWTDVRIRHRSLSDPRHAEATVSWRRTVPGENGRRTEVGTDELALVHARGSWRIVSQETRLYAGVEVASSDPR